MKLITLKESNYYGSSLLKDSKFESGAGSIDSILKQLL